MKYGIEGGIMNSKMVGATALCVAFIASGAFAQDFCNAKHSGSKKTVSFTDAVSRMTKARPSLRCMP